MADRIYPSAKPSAAAAPSFPATKSQLYNASRPVYRPQPPKPRRRRRNICCSLCLWLTLLLVALLFLAAIAGGVFYLIYKPRRPSFTVSSLKLTALNITSSDLLTSHIDLTVTARNPNKKLVYLYDPITIAVTTADGAVAVGNGAFPAFVHEAGNTTVMKAAVTSSGDAVDATAAKDLKKKTSIPIEIKMETKAGVKVGSLKSKKIGVSVTCDGATVSVPKGKGSAASGGGDVICKVKVRVKVWKWNLYS